jgi:hypothetical protein
VPTWALSVSMGYMAVLFAAAIWTTVERTRAAIGGRTHVPVDSDVDAAESMTERELEAEREAAELLTSA